MATVKIKKGAFEISTQPNKSWGLPYPSSRSGQKGEVIGREGDRLRVKFADGEIAVFDELSILEEAQLCRRCGYPVGEGEHGQGKCPAGAYGANIGDEP